ncbi:hypothetical protein VNO77_08195 [Canavalia gladiata]|uniref:Uncharacterized protein n=1 Tax=Canavalia gladiata TaxID=3824 RepID=A0AAN9QWY9_CANGL
MTSATLAHKSCSSLDKEGESQIEIPVCDLLVRDELEMVLPDVKGCAAGDYKRLISKHLLQDLRLELQGFTYIIPLRSIKKCLAMSNESFSESVWAELQFVFSRKWPLALLYLILGIADARP